MIKIMAELENNVPRASIDTEDHAALTSSSNQNINEEDMHDQIASTIENESGPSGGNLQVKEDTRHVLDIDSEDDNFECLLKNLENNILSCPENSYKSKVERLKNMLVSVLSKSRFDNSANDKRGRNTLGKEKQEDSVKILKIEKLGDKFCIAKDNDDEFSFSFREILDIESPDA